MAQEKISVIVPVYNLEALLPKTLDSILAQTHRDLEVIVVDDGSGDGTAEVAGRYAARDNRVRVIRQENGGVTSARLRGVREATGAWIGFVDGDDTIEPEMYERLLSNALRYRADISHCGYEMVLPSGNTRYYYNTGKIAVQDTDVGLKDLLEGCFVEPTLSNKLYARHIWDAALEAVTFDPSIKNMEDLLMNFYLFREAKRSVYEDFCPYHYIVRASSAANAPVNIHQLEDPLKVKKILFKETEGSPVHHALAADQLVRQLVSFSMMDIRRSPAVMGPVRVQARAELRRMLGGILRSGDYSWKFKIMGAWTAVFPGSYALVHRLYEKITGLDQIYEK